MSFKNVGPFSVERVVANTVQISILLSKPYQSDLFLGVIELTHGTNATSGEISLGAAGPTSGRRVRLKVPAEVFDAVRVEAAVPSSVELRIESSNLDVVRLTIIKDGERFVHDLNTVSAAALLAPVALPSREIQQEDTA